MLKLEQQYSELTEQIISSTHSIKKQSDILTEVIPHYDRVPLGKI